jgi:KUP system potassium uptake protein
MPCANRYWRQSAQMHYGDAMITPALSVLSGVGGLEVITRPSLAMSFRFRLSSCLPCLRCSHGALQGSPPFFGPITLVWFAVLAIGGAWHVAQN